MKSPLSPCSLSAALLSVVTFSGATVAQIAVAPIDQTDPSAPAGGPYHYEGSTSTSQWPFSGGVSRVHMIYESSRSGTSLLGIPNGRQITSISFPRDSTFVVNGQAILLEISMAHTLKTAATAETTFANNFTSPPVVVRPQAIFNLPTMGDVAGSPVRCEVPLTTPFTYDASQNLLVEFKVFANANSNQSFSYRLDVAGVRSEVSSLGQACMTSGGRTPLLRSTATAIGSNWRVSLSNSPASTNCALQIGFAPLPGPIPIPGAGGCTIDIVTPVGVPGTTNTGGSVSWTFPVGDDISLWHLNVYSQAFCVDFFANPLGIVSSNADVIEFGIDPPQTMIYRTGDANAPTGFVWRNFGLVTYFHHN